MEHLPGIIRQLHLDPRLGKLVTREIILPAYLENYQAPDAYYG